MFTDTTEGTQTHWPSSLSMLQLSETCNRFRLHIN